MRGAAAQDGRGAKCGYAIPVKMTKVTCYDKYGHSSSDGPRPVYHPVTLSNAIGQAVKDDPRSPYYLMSIINLSRLNPWADVIAGRALEVWIATGLPIVDRDFSHCRISLANFDRGDFRTCDFTTCLIHTCNLARASFDNRCQLSRATFKNCQTAKMLVSHFYCGGSAITVVDLVTGFVKVVARFEWGRCVFFYNDIFYVSLVSTRDVCCYKVEPLREPLVKNTGLKRMSDKIIKTDMWQAVSADRAIPMDDRVLLVTFLPSDDHDVRQGIFQVINPFDRLSGIGHRQAVIGHRVYFARLNKPWLGWRLVCYDADLDQWKDIAIPFTFHFHDICSVGSCIWLISTNREMAKYDPVDEEWTVGKTENFSKSSFLKLLSHNGRLFIVEYGDCMPLIHWFDEDRWEFFGQVRMSDVPNDHKSPTTTINSEFWTLEWKDEEVRFEVGVTKEREWRSKRRRRRRSELELLAD